MMETKLIVKENQCESFSTQPNSKYKLYFPSSSQPLGLESPEDVRLKSRSQVTGRHYPMDHKNLKLFDLKGYLVVRLFLVQIYSGLTSPAVFRNLSVYRTAGTGFDPA